ncbi:MAG: orotidine-5'-phosphate decarboxylase [Pseudomonadota bacterium]
MPFTTPQSRLILPLDTTDAAHARALVTATDGLVGVYKIGLEFVMAGGLSFAQALAGEGRSVFLDMKLLDIENTVEGAVRGAGALGADYVTVHAYPQGLQAAVRVRPEGLQIIAVTVLTSLDNDDLARAGYQSDAASLVALRIAEAAAIGVDCIVCSPEEAAVAHASGLTVITPGVRLEGDAVGDQKRVATPQQAIMNGADAVVVGRPITQAPDPRAAAERVVAAIAEGLHMREAAAGVAPV